MRPCGRTLVAVAMLGTVVAGCAAGGDAPHGDGHAATASTAGPVATFSIVAFDPATGDLGIAVQSKFFAVGSVVPWAAAGVGAVATQSFANTDFGPDGLELLRAGNDARRALDTLIAADARSGLRQVGIVDADGNVASFTGDACLAWAGGRQGDHFTVQGNILAGPEVVDAMAGTFESTDGSLATRLLAALAAGQDAGGDARGRQSAALLVVRAGGGFGGQNDRYIDLRVDDHETPIVELQRLLDIFQGRQADAAAQRTLGEAEQASGAVRNDLLQQALRTAESATVMDPRNGGAWMTLARIHVELGDLAAAGASGRRALTVDPWIKSAVLRGIDGSTRLVEALLENDEFRRLWESIEVR